MLADGGAQEPSLSGLRAGLHLPATQFRKLIAFIAHLLPRWRNDATRHPVTAEDDLSDQLCDFLNDEARKVPGPEGFKFQRETRDDGDRRRKLDIAAKTSGSTIEIGERHYDGYSIFLPIECKRLPMPEPNRQDRDAREYVFDQHKSAGGVQRFKLGAHGSKHSMAAMIGYVQDRGILHWQAQVGTWIDELVDLNTPLWSSDDNLTLDTHDIINRSAILRSNHARNGDLAAIDVNHLWIEM